MENYISKEGLENLKKELENLKRKRYEIAQLLEEAKALGDLSENHEYHEAREAQAFNEGRIQELEEKIKDARIITGKGNSEVRVGSALTVKFNGDKKTFTIVGSEEADPPSGKISNESPIGKAFIGKKVGDEVAVDAPSGKKIYKIIEIS